MERESVIGQAIRLHFDENWESFHDVLVELTFVKGEAGRAFTKQACKEAFDLLPHSIKMDALKWGLGDTEVRDSAYVYLKSINWKPSS